MATYEIRLNKNNNSMRLTHVKKTVKLVQTGRKGQKGDPGDPATNLVTSVNGKQGVVVLNSSDVGADPSGSAAQALNDAKAYTDQEVGDIDTGVLSVTAGTNVTVDNTDPKNPIVSASGGGDVESVNGQTGVVVLDADDIDDTSTTHKFVTSADLTKLSNTSGTNTGDQTLSGLGGVPTTRTINGLDLSANRTLTQDNVGDGTTYKQYSSTEKTKLSGIETGADVTDATNVAAAGAVMTSGSQVVNGSKTFTATTFINSADSETFPRFRISNAGTGDAVMRYELGTARSYIQGIDNDDSDKFKIATAATGTAGFGGGNDVLTIETNGDITTKANVNGRNMTTDGSKLDGIEASADVTDATNVDAAGAVMEADTSTASMSFVVDEDDMASNSATKVPTQQSTKAYIDNKVSGEQVYGEDTLPYEISDPNLGSWFTKIGAVRTTPINVLILGDSISGTIFNNSQWGTDLTAFDYESWGMKWERLMNKRMSINGYKPKGYLMAQGDQYVPSFTTTQGNNPSPLYAWGLGYWGSELENNEVATVVENLTHFALVYGKHPTGGQIEIRDGGPAGTLLTTIDTAGTEKSSFIWQSNNLGHAAHTIHIKAVCDSGETVRLEGARVDVSLATGSNPIPGVRVWQAAHGGAWTSSFTGQPQVYRDFIENNNPDLILTMTGTNDDVGNIQSRLEALFAQIRAVAPTTPIVQVIPYVSSGFTLEEIPLVKAACAAYDVPWINLNVFTGALSQENNYLTIDGLHPNVNGRQAIADAVGYVLSGNPLTTMAQAIAKKADINTPIFYRAQVTDSLVVNKIDLASGAFTISNLFNYPVFTFKEPGDAISEISLVTKSLSAFSGGPAAPVINFTNGTDGTGLVNLYRSAADTLKTDDNFIVGTPGTASGSAVTVDGTQTLTNKTHTSPVLNTGVSGTAIDTDTTLTANSDTKLASQKATKAYADAVGTYLAQRGHQVVAKESGQYYSMPGLASANSAHGLSAAGAFSAMPVWLQAGSYDRIAVVTTIAAVSTWRFGVYPTNPATGLPDGQTLILDCGTIDMNSVAGVLTATISLTIPTTGVYWLATLCDAYTASPTAIIWTSTSNTAQSPLLGAPTQMSAATATRHNVGRSTTGVSTGSMPGTCPTLVWNAIAIKTAVRAA